ncbi:MAG: NAD(P)/FAD-dependent oxidoreductase [Actinobacteria bacterium]|nr:MAG: NAD(P)/FAD-dependent oxidoreductase [Actinomycetota bacterium]
MKRILILGAGTAGTMAANKLHKKLGGTWDITIVDQDEIHYYQPGFLFIPFGSYRPEDVIRTKREFVPKGVNYVSGNIATLDPESNKVTLADGTELGYEYLIIATGTHPTPSETPGLDGPEYGKTVHDFYTFEGSVALRDALAKFESGRLVVNLIEMPIKCPVAPLEFALLAESHFTKLGTRDNIEIVYVTPLDAAFTQPVAAKHLGSMLGDRMIVLEPDFYLERIDAENKKLVSYDEREIDYDLLVTVPINMGADFVHEAGLGDEMRHVNVDHHNFLSKDHDNIFAIGDAANLPTSKAGSVAHFAMDVFVPNFVNHVKGLPMEEEFDGHSNCYIETGYNKAMLIDFNYETQPLPGKYPVPGFGPFSLLKESEINHWGKLAFKWMYWNMLLAGRDIPVPSHMMMAGKDRSAA